MKKITFLALCGMFVGTLSANALLAYPITLISQTDSSLTFSIDINEIGAFPALPFLNFDGGGTIVFTSGQTIVVTFNDPHTDTIDTSTGTPVDNGPLFASSITPDGGGEYTVTYNNAVPDSGNTLVLLSLAAPALAWFRRRTATATV